MLTPTFAVSMKNEDQLEKVDPMEIPYSVPEEQVTEQMRAERQEMLEKYPGLVLVDPAEIDPDEEIIYVDGMEGLDELMSGINAINLYTGQNDNRLEVENFLREQDAANKVASVTEPAYAVMASAAYGDAPAYRQENSTSINCYGYAGDFNWWINPGDIYYTKGSQFGVGSTVNDVATWVINDFWRAYKVSIHTITSATATISSGERRIAVRVGDRYVNIDGSSVRITDYHFMRQTDTGRWSHKPGSLPSIYTTIRNPSSASWDLYGSTSSGSEVVYPGFYNSAVVYIAL